MAVTAVHVERTADPCVVRWVTHDTELASNPAGSRSVPADAALAPLLSSGSVDDVAVSGGDVLVRFAAPAAIARSIAAVHAAVVADLERRADWLFAAIPGPPAEPPSIQMLQHTVDAAVGHLLDAHGGRIEVIDLVDGRVRVRLHGECRGCAGVDSTLHVAVRAAVLAGHAGVVDVVELPDPGARPHRIPTAIGLIARRRDDR
jgi:Fe-S cluster biogenesis protein NfuA